MTESGDMMQVYKRLAERHDILWFSRQDNPFAHIEASIPLIEFDETWEELPKGSLSARRVTRIPIS